MSHYGKEIYAAMLDQLLSEELAFNASAASEGNIKSGMKRVLGRLIKKGILKRYNSFVLDDQLNVHLTIVDAYDSEFDITLYYGQ